MIDFDRINGSALSVLPALLARWLPDGRQHGHEWIARNPRRNDRSPGSFKVNMVTGKWADFATGDTGGDVISLVAFLFGTGKAEAARHLSSMLESPMKANAMFRPPAADEARTGNRTAADEWTPVVASESNPLLHDTIQRYCPAGQSFTESWSYHLADGRLVFHVVRYDCAGGANAQAPKQVVPFTWCEGPGGKQEWRMKAWPALRPLYRLNAITANPGTPVLVAEGEKAADAAQVKLRDYVVTTSPGGSNAGGRPTGLH